MQVSRGRKVWEAARLEPWVGIYLVRSSVWLLILCLDSPGARLLKLLVRSPSYVRVIYTCQRAIAIVIAYLPVLNSGSRNVSLPIKPELQIETRLGHQTNSTKTKKNNKINRKNQICYLPAKP